MAAKFSAIDDTDEKATRLYIVIGRLDKFYKKRFARTKVGKYTAETLYVWGERAREA